MPLVTRLTTAITAIPAVLKNNCQTYVSYTNHKMYFSNAAVLHPPYSYQHMFLAKMKKSVDVMDSSSCVTSLFPCSDSLWSTTP